MAGQRSLCVSHLGNLKSKQGGEGKARAKQTRPGTVRGSDDAPKIFPLNAERGTREASPVWTEAGQLVGFCPSQSARLCQSLRFSHSPTTAEGRGGRLQVPKREKD